MRLIIETLIYISLCFICTIFLTLINKVTSYSFYIIDYIIVSIIYLTTIVSCILCIYVVKYYLKGSKL